MMRCDVAVIGAGAAGMMCAAVAGQRGARVVLIDHATKLAEKIRISGGGRCNFTNRNAGPANYLSNNPHFCRSALARYTPQDFIGLVSGYRIPYHEKHKGQLFCDDSAEDIIRMLEAECDKSNVLWRAGCAIAEVGKAGDAYRLATSAGEIVADKLVIATGGLSIPKIGATDFGYRIARQFGLKIVETHPALVPLTFQSEHWAPFAALSGVSMEVDVTVAPAAAAGKAGHRGNRGGATTFREDLLLTHRGLSGPAVLQISSFWSAGQPLSIDLLPDTDAAQWLCGEKAGSRKQLGTVLAQRLPERVAQAWCATHGASPHAPIAELSDKVLRTLGCALNRWALTPSGSEGYRKAEVTRGGVDTRALSSATMEAQAAPGLHFIGEVVDVTGWLGGYNFQWAWASAVAAGLAVAGG
ncbi:MULTISPECIES: NAD(P)/FAD-dependent oxidoreductase [Ralstonia solanacearum species complex]|uniref:Putative oxidoreductase with FAD/NAD(P)-binding domain n=2 Tax=Ralstonia solanacearum species complex TaxID=3116862 RepID=A0A0S4UV67_RALSL|nr:NAD(P)/FAD-dependent oxidoreductase [Ralstonia pseudosolanacearum]AOE90139.1 uncharacterized protein LBM341_01865 [Ralstonia solanacearum]AXW56985.1 aminoacetone oxidase family FAD-binding enzyme [Ralstonia solanacearum]MDC6294724.1 NAD(P)/FAD-dependent oxidoreductase [Ralstonia pseudosolanacearum]MDD7789324.1 NAD(P)/FAD-dependent oxidoreductase [Ralstonia pseudosolanacearum]MDN3369996.1 NAD(P)/FAD-dependent oxidoreductase [Ralstonia pseudosolanacearum]